MSAQGLIYPWLMWGDEPFCISTWEVRFAEKAAMLYNAIVGGGEEAVPGLFVECDESIPRHVQLLHGINVEGKNVGVLSSPGTVRASSVESLDGRGAEL